MCSIEILILKFTNELTINQSIICVTISFNCNALTWKYTTLFYNKPCFNFLNVNALVDKNQCLK